MYAITLVASSNVTACPFDPTRANNMATTTLLDLRRTDPVCERADRLEKQELVARVRIYLSHTRDLRHSVPILDFAQLPKLRTMKVGANGTEDTHVERGSSLVKGTPSRYSNH